MNRVLAASLALLIAGCTAAAAAPDSASAPAAAPATTQRVLFDMGPAYFPGALPHGETLVGAPPAAGSDAMARDERLSAAGVALYGSERFKLSAPARPGAAPSRGPASEAAAVSLQRPITSAMCSSPLLPTVASWPPSAPTPNGSTSPMLGDRTVPPGLPLIAAVAAPEPPKDALDVIVPHI